MICVVTLSAVDLLSRVSYCLMWILSRGFDVDCKIR